MERGSGVGHGPGQGVLERGKEVDHSPGNDDLVVERDAVSGNNGSQTDTGKSGVDTTEHTDVTTLEFLTHRQLKEHHRDTNKEKAEQVGDEENSTTILVREVRESPEVTKTNGRSNSSENERAVARPSLSFSSEFLFVTE